ncbi:MAG: class B sortase [Oscillospiraceae bacterium]|nr:class B sortase [Oscillospiraceae bacterium]
MKKSVKVLLFLLCAVFVGVFLFSGYKLYSIVHGYKTAERQYDSLTDRYVAAASPTPTAAAQPFPAQTAPEATPEPERSPIQVDFNELRNESADVVGWIYSEGTQINYPIAQSLLDNHATAEYYYLYRDIHGNYSGNGTPFLDSYCAADFNNYNSIVYGHHMKDGSMFASLDYYRTAGYYEQHPVMYLNTPGQNYRIDIFAGYVTDADSNTYTIFFPDDNSFLLYCQDMKAQSDFPSNVAFQAGDRIITLSTCSYEWNDARYVIQGKLVPID